MSKSAEPSGEQRPPWRELAVGTWFVEDSPSCTNRFSVQERTHGGCTIVCSTPYIHDRAKRQLREIVDAHNRAVASEPGTSANPPLTHFWCDCGRGLLVEGKVIGKEWWTEPSEQNANLRVVMPPKAARPTEAGSTSANPPDEITLRLTKTEYEFLQSALGGYIIYTRKRNPPESQRTEHLADALAERVKRAGSTSANFVSDQIHEGPTCTLCGAVMVFKCLSCGSTPQLTEANFVSEAPTKDVKEAYGRIEPKWTDQEWSVIHELAERADISPAKILQQALRTYQLVAEGYMRLVETHPELKLGGSTPEPTAPTQPTVTLPSTGWKNTSQD